MTEKKIPVDSETIKKICSQYPTPFHLYDEKAIINNLHALQKAFSWVDGFKEYFAVKATPNPFIMKLLHNNGGIGFR